MSDDELEHYGLALDEVYRLRAALAEEAQLIKTHLGGRRKWADEQVQRMEAAARGQAIAVYASSGRKAALRAAGASGTLTRWGWEHQP